ALAPPGGGRSKNSAGKGFASPSVIYYIVPGAGMQGFLTGFTVCGPAFLYRNKKFTVEPLKIRSKRSTIEAAAEGTGEWEA
ncbi:MAG TPA: hypothetical protein H9835_02345, partial [Candidatus Agathobaculum merdigallinarum]|nr:hypothetical protein [Candidatus Agathobaculum merdigallinarum]